MLCASIVLQATAARGGDNNKSNGEDEPPCELLSDIECCVASPAVREVWPSACVTPPSTVTTTSSGEDDGFGHTLRWQELFSPTTTTTSCLREFGPPSECLPFLHLYPTPRTNAMSATARHMTRQVIMRVLRRRLRQLMQSEPTRVHDMADCIKSTTSETCVEVTWTARLLCYVVSSLSDICTTNEDDLCCLTVTSMPVQCTCLPVRDWLQRPREARANVTRSDTLSLRLRVTSLALCTQSRHDAYMAGKVLRCLYKTHLVPAERHRSCGTEELQSISPEATTTLSEHSYDEAIAEYDAAAQRAQDGLLWLYNHCPSQESYDGPVTAVEQQMGDHHEIEEAAVRSARAIHATLRALYGEDHATHSKILAPAKLRMTTAAAEYVNEALLCLRLDEAHDPELQRLHDEVWHKDTALQPAREALAWRCPHTTKEECVNSVLAPVTTLQVVLYALQRCLVSAIANVSHVVLLQCRLMQQQCEGKTTSPGLSLKALAARASSCEKAATATLRLLRWHRPTHKQQASHSTVASDAELRWCYTMYCKLLLRSARLWNAAGDASRRRATVHTLQDALRRWRHRRELATSAVAHKASDTKCDSDDDASNTSEEEVGEANAETLVCRLSDEHWAQLERDVSAGLRQP